MEPRNYESGAAAAPPSEPVVPSNGYPTAGDAQSATPATKPGAFWFYKIGESLRKIITDAGITPDDGDLTQLKTALVSPQTDVDAGTDDNRFVTPKKLRWGFSVLLATNGFIVFPSWLGGFLVQWGTQAADGSGNAAVTFPLAFPSACYVTSSIHLGTASVTNVEVPGTLSLTGVTFKYLDYTNTPGAHTGKWIALGG